MRSFRVRPVIVLGERCFDLEELTKMVSPEGATVFEDWRHVSYVMDHAQGQKYIDHLTEEPRFYGKI